MHSRGHTAHTVPYWIKQPRHKETLGPAVDETMDDQLACDHAIPNAWRHAVWNSVDSSVSDWCGPHSPDPHALKSAQCDAFSLVRHLVPPSAATAGGSLRVDTPLWV